MKDQSARVGLYRRVGKSSPQAGEYGLQAIGEDDPLFTRPTLLCCGGSGSQKNHPQGIRNANGFAKFGHALLGFKDAIAPGDPIDIIAVSYPGNTLQLQDDTGRLTKRTLAGKVSYNLAADNLMYDHIEPLLADKAGHPRAPETVLRGLRNIHILAHSYGGAFARQLGFALKARLKELFPQDPQFVREAMSQVLVVTGGTAAPLGGGKGGFTTIDVLISDDRVAGQHFPGEETQKRLLENMLKRNGQMHPQLPGIPARPLNIVPIRFSSEPLKIVKDSDSRQYLVYASPQIVGTQKGVLFAQGMDPAMERSSKCGFFGPNGNAEKCGEPPAEGENASKKESHPRGIDHNLHEPETYFSFGLGPHGFMLRTAVSSVLANGMNNAIRNQQAQRFTPLPEPKALLKCPQKLLYPLDTMEIQPSDAQEPETIARDFTKIARAIGYNSRIAAACGERGR